MSPYSYVKENTKNTKYSWEKSVTDSDKFLYTQLYFKIYIMKAIIIIIIFITSSMTYNSIITKKTLVAMAIVITNFFFKILI